MRAALLSAAFLAGVAHAELPTERYAPAQLRVAQSMLDRARAAAAAGDAVRARRLAWQANLDARLAWVMTEAELLRLEAAEIGAEARDLVMSLPK